MAENKSVVEIVKDTINVREDGTVTFRTRSGRGSGKSFEIPSEQFEEFVKILENVKKQ